MLSWPTGLRSVATTWRSWSGCWRRWKGMTLLRCWNRKVTFIFFTFISKYEVHVFSDTSITEWIWPLGQANKITLSRTTTSGLILLVRPLANIVYLERKLGIPAQVIICASLVRLPTLAKTDVIMYILFYNQVHIVIDISFNTRRCNFRSTLVSIHSEEIRSYQRTIIADSNAVKFWANSVGSFLETWDNYWILLSNHRADNVFYALYDN